MHLVTSRESVQPPDVVLKSLRVSVCNVIYFFFCLDCQAECWFIVSYTRALYAQTHRSGSCFRASVVSYDDINVILNYVFKQHLNVHKAHDFFCSPLHLASCFEVNISTRFVLWMDCHVLDLGEGLLLVCISIWGCRPGEIENEGNTCKLFRFLFRSCLVGFSLFLFHMWFACIKFCKNRVCTASLYDGIGYWNK